MTTFENDAHIIKKDKCLGVLSVMPSVTVFFKPSTFIKLCF